MSSIKREFEKPKPITIKLTVKEATIFQERVVRICNDVILNHEILSEQEQENFEILKNMCDQVTDQLATIPIQPIVIVKNEEKEDNQIDSHLGITGVDNNKK